MRRRLFFMLPDVAVARKVLLMVDVPFRRVDDIHELVVSHHPEAEWGGMAPQIPALP